MQQVTSAFTESYRLRKDVLLEGELTIKQFEPKLKCYPPGFPAGQAKYCSKYLPQSTWVASVIPQGLDRGIVKTIVTVALIGDLVTQKKAIEAGFRIYFQNPDPHKTSIGARRAKILGSQSSYEWRQSFDPEQVKAALTEDGSITVIVQIDFMGPGEQMGSNCGTDGGATNVTGPSDQLLIDNNSWRFERDTSISTLKVGDESVRVHTAVLHELSSILKHEITEAKGVLPVGLPPGYMLDATAKPFKAMTSYGYSRVLGDDTPLDLLFDLLTIASAWEIGSLENDAERMVAAKLSNENFCRIASVLTEKPHLKRLERACRKHFASNQVAIVKMPEWSAMAAKNPKLADELFNPKAATNSER